MTDLFGVFSRVDPLGHVILDNDRNTVCEEGRIPHWTASASEGDVCSRSAKSIVLAARTHTVTGF